MAKEIPWVKVKKDYLEGITPKELAEKYKTDIEKIYKKIENGKWALELSEIKGNVGNKVQARIEHVTNLALERLEGILLDEDIKTSDLVNAIGKAFDVSGLKSSKSEITGKDGSALIQKVFVSAKEIKDTDNHIDSVIDE